MLAAAFGLIVAGGGGLVFAAGGAGSGQQIPIALVSAAVSGLGVVMSGKVVVPTFAYKREQERADRAEARAEKAEALNLQFAEALADRVVPAMERNTAATRESTEAWRGVILRYGQGQA